MIIKLKKSKKQKKYKKPKLYSSIIKFMLCLLLICNFNQNLSFVNNSSNDTSETYLNAESLVRGSKSSPNQNSNLQYSQLEFKLDKKKINKTQHLINGNKNSLNILTWNKDKKFAVNAIDRISDVIINNDADIAVINEANLDIKQDMNLMKIKGYHMEYDKMYINYNRARTIMYIKKYLSYDRVKKYENNDDSAICIKIGLPHKSKFFIYGMYRQWSLPGIIDSDKMVNNIIRWEKTISTMSKMFDENKETIICGDINLNTLSFNKKMMIRTLMKNPYPQCTIYSWI